MKLGALLLGAIAAIVAASVLVPPSMEREEIQRVPLLPAESAAPRAENEADEVTPVETNTGTATTTTRSDEQRSSGSSIADPEPAGGTVAEGQSTDETDEDEEDDCPTSDEDFPWCDEDPPSER